MWKTVKKEETHPAFMDLVRKKEEKGKMCSRKSGAKNVGKFVENSVPFL